MLDLFDDARSWASYTCWYWRLAIVNVILVNVVRFLFRLVCASSLEAGFVLFGHGAKFIMRNAFEYDRANIGLAKASERANSFVPLSFGRKVRPGACVR